MKEKKTTVEEFNKEFFNQFMKIKSVTPHFVDWQTGDEDGTTKWKEIERIDIEFENGKKLSIVPKCNRLEEDYDTENQHCLFLEIVKFEPRVIDWRTP